MPDITNPYDAVIADLEAKRAEIDAAVRLMKKLRDRIGMSVADDAGSGWKDEIQLALGAENDIPSDAFFGMTIADAAVKYLGKWTNRKPQSFPGRWEQRARSFHLMVSGSGSWPETS